MIKRTIAMTTTTAVFFTALFTATFYLQVDAHAQTNKIDVRPIIASAQNGDKKAQFELGLLFESGHGVRQNLTKAAEWYAKSAAQNFGPAQARLGFLYQSGRGVPKDSAKAAELYKQSAEAGDATGQFLLGVAYINAIGLPQDSRRGAEFIFKAAKAGHQQARMMFGMMLLNGAAVKKNFFAARRWFEKATVGPDSELAEQARKIVKQIDQKVLFSGAFRPEDIAAVAAITIGTAALLAAILPHQSVARKGYDQEDYDQEQEEIRQREQNDLCNMGMAAGDNAAMIFNCH